MFDSGWTWRHLFLMCCAIVAASARGGKRERGGRIPCDPRRPYPNHDGTCHNLANPTFGMAGAVFRRLLPPRYEDDDGQTPRLTGVDGAPLPSPRTVSATVHENESQRSNQGTMMLMQWAQFLDHDVSFSPDRDHMKCCSDDLVFSGELHRDVRKGGPCFPIIVDKNDHYFKDVSSRCLEFKRSPGVYDSHNVRQQYNQASSWIDASHIYGTTRRDARKLRSLKNGKLRVENIGGHEFLPEDEDSTDKTCFRQEKGDYCFKAGDTRVNQFPGLTALHTIFVRYHNQVCDRLRAVHPRWKDGRLYNVARRVVIAVIQKISYGQFMRQILGPIAAEFDLHPGAVKFVYDETVDPTLTNVFSTAAYRFGHSMIKDSLTIDGKVVKTGKLFMRPRYVLESLPGLVRALIDEKCEKTDRYYSQGMTDRLFEKPNDPTSGRDIVSINIQRGRDHGLPPYNEWRELFGLKRKSFNDMGSKRYRKVYSSPDDIDLYSGGVNEESLKGAMVGQLFATILTKQFRDLKFGDRFWFENQDDETSFSKGQIHEILKITLSKVICHTVPGFKKIQPNVFKPVGPDNELTKCLSLPDIDFEQFRA
ncbi:hypothetical protein Btru_071458 [Bulinus truncatus]|nr:hypothetical protein Btru_071458 [Bulinus truncatus]